MINKKASLFHQVITHVVIIGLLFGLFFLASMAKANSRAVKQQVLEKELALLIDEAVPGMSFYISKRNLRGVINKVFVKNNKIFTYVDNLEISQGYPFFSKYDIKVEEDKDGFFVKVR
jgi:hypothetical protein